MNAIDLFTSDDIKLAEHAEVIRALGKRAARDIVEIGERLIDAKDRCGHGNWSPWLEREFGWSDDAAQRYIRVGDAAKNRNLRDLNVPVSGLYLLAASRGDRSRRRAERAGRAGFARRGQMADR